MKLQQIIAIVLLLSMMFNAGLQADRSDFFRVLKNYGLLARALFANFVIVPLGAFAIITALRVNVDVGTGLLLMAIAPGVPFIILSGGTKKGGHHSFAVELALILSMLSFITIPLMAELLFPASERVHVPPSQVFSLLSFQLAPLVVGAIAAAIAPSLTARLKGPLTTITFVALFALLAVLAPSIIRSFLIVVGSGGILAAVFIDVLSLIAGWLLGGPGLADRFTLAIATALRNPAIAMVLATTAFKNPGVVAGVVTYFLVQFVGATVFGGKGVRRFAARVAARAQPASG